MLENMYAIKVIAVALCILFLAGCFASPPYEGDVTFNFDGTVFHNREPIEQNPLDMIKLGWGVLTKSERWPGWVENSPTETSLVPNKSDIQVTYINHATTLIQVNGLNILTDPIYSDRASPVNFAGPKRVREPGVPLDSLPPIDVILISHNHYDHLDVETLQRISKQQNTPPLILAGLGNGGLFKEIGLQKFQDMQWNESTLLGGVEFIFVECRHRSGRGISDQMKSLWGSFVVKAPQGSIYFAGDTAYSPHLKEHGEQFGPFELAILPIGAYEPRWFMSEVHMNPTEAVQAHLDLNSQQSLSIHFGVFQLTYEGIDAPEQALKIALQDLDVDPAQFWALEPGQTKLVQTD